jgi:cytochrome b6-f complex iron-sulfur subunit
MNRNRELAMNVTPSNVEPDQNRPKPLPRRDFLTVAWKSLLGLTGLLGLGGIFQFLSYQPYPSPPTAFDLGVAEDFPLGTRARIPDAQAVLQHGADGLKAYSLVCTHLGCMVDLVKEGFSCPCHGSQFDLNGTVEHGPATTPLQELRLEVNDQGRLILHTDEPA